MVERASAVRRCTRGFDVLTIVATRANPRSQVSLRTNLVRASNYTVIQRPVSSWRHQKIKELTDDRQANYGKQVSLRPLNSKRAYSLKKSIADCTSWLW